MSEPPEDDGTDPSIRLPTDPPTEEIALPPASEPPPPPPPPPPRTSPTSAPPPRQPPPTAGGTLPPRPPGAPLGRLPPSGRLPQGKPAAAPKPRTEPYRPSRPARPPERQRLMQMQTQLDQARSAVARQRNELDELRTELAAREERLRSMLDELRDSGGQDAVAERLRQLDERGEALAEELRRRIETEQQSGAARVEAIESRMRQLEEGTSITRLRMRLDRVNVDLRNALDRIDIVERTQREIIERLDADAGRERRLSRLESLFEELSDELRRGRDLGAIDELSARLADLEALTVQTGTNLREQTDKLQKLSESIAPPPAVPRELRAAASDDLTKVKGIGPKYAKLLGEIGVTSVAQIAAWTDDDVERAAAGLGIKASRIRKAGWGASARALATS